MNERARRFSDDEVAAILKRTAELSASGTVGRGGASLSDIERIAEEAGLDPSLVRRAARELGDTEPPTWVETLVGGPSRISLEAEIDGGLDPELHPELLDAIHRLLHEPGHMSAAGAAFTWSVSNQSRKLLVTVTPRNGKTVVRIEERLGNLIGGIWGGVGGGVGGSIVPFLGIAGGALLGPIGVAGAVAGGLVATLGGTRAIYGAVTRRRRRALQDLLGELTAIVEARTPADDTRTLDEVRPAQGLPPAVGATPAAERSSADDEQAALAAHEEARSSS